ncbi:hypothetical protein DFJ73DRAFT_796094 [Zopfochytrium polystomum]|nr:hypothetical protein DFJ73DRAFT_796094 [Zopfochytrium polystomum]
MQKLSLPPSQPHGPPTPPSPSSLSLHPLHPLPLAARALAIFVIFLGTFTATMLALAALEDALFHSSPPASRADPRTWPPDGASFYVLAWSLCSNVSSLLLSHAYLLGRSEGERRRVRAAIWAFSGSAVAINLVVAATAGRREVVVACSAVARIPSLAVFAFYVLHHNDTHFPTKLAKCFLLSLVQVTMEQAFFWIIVGYVAISFRSNDDNRVAIAALTTLLMVAVTALQGAQFKQLSAHNVKGGRAKPAELGREDATLGASRATVVSVAASAVVSGDFLGSAGDVGQGNDDFVRAMGRHLSLSGVIYLAPTAMILRYCGTDPFAFALLAVLFIAAKPALAIATTTASAVSQRARARKSAARTAAAADTTVLASLAAQNSYFLFHDAVSDACGLAAGVVLAAAFLAPDAPATPSLSPDCRTSLDGTTAAAAAGAGAAMLAALVVQGVGVVGGVRAVAGWMARRRRRRDVGDEDGGGAGGGGGGEGGMLARDVGVGAEGGEVEGEVEEDEEQAGFAPLWESAGAGGFVAAGVAAMVLAYVRGIIGEPCGLA